MGTLVRGCVAILLAFAALQVTGCASSSPAPIAAGSNGGGSGTAPLVLTSLAVVPANISLLQGETLQYAATGTYNNGSTETLTVKVQWRVSGAVAAITAGGLLTANAPGQATVSATSDAVAGTTQLTVTAPARVLTGILVTPATASVPSPATLQYSAVGTYNDGSTESLPLDVRWSISNQNITSSQAATITPTGLLTATSAGQITVTAAVGQVSGTASLLITPHTAIAASFTTSTAPLAGEDLAAPCIYDMDLLDTTLPISGVWVIFERADSLPLWQDADLRALAATLQLGLVYAHQCNAASYPDLLSDGRKGPARALRSALDAFATLSGHAEVAQANLVLFGFSAAGVLSITSAETMPGRVLTAVTCAAGSAPLELRQLTPSTSFEAVPLLMLANSADAAAGDSMSQAYFATGRNAGAPWAFAVQPGITHCCTFTVKPLLLAWVAAIVPLRQAAGGAITPVLQGRGSPGSYTCTPDGITDGRGYTDCVFSSATFPAPAAASPNSPTVWLPNAAVGNAWLSWVGFPQP